MALQRGVTPTYKQQQSPVGMDKVKRPRSGLPRLRFGSPAIYQLGVRVPRLFSLAVVIAVLSVSACDTANEQKTFVEDAQAEPAGITSTDANGGVVSQDADDWRTAPVYVGRIIVDPIYPNPFVNGVATLPFRILQFDEIAGGVFVRAFDTQGKLFSLGEVVETSSPGLYTITINPSQLGTKGLHRLFVQDVFGEVVSYGDLLVN